MGKLRNMQYKEGKKVRKSIVKNWRNNDSLIFAPSANNPAASTARKEDISRSQINATPAFCILEPLPMVNSSFSLSKVRCELYFTSITTPIVASKNIMPPKGCGTINSDANPIKNISANIRFQKLSLLNLEAIKPVCSVAEFCIFRALFCFCGSVNVAKFSIITYCTYWFKTYNLIISKYYAVLKQIIRNIRAFALCFKEVGRLATPVNNRDRANIREVISKTELQYKIPSGLLSAIAKVESDTREFAVNVNGRAIYANTLAEAITIAKAQINTGKQNIDIGVMQLNYRWHGKQFSSLEEMLTQKKNIAYAAGLLRSLYKQHGNWQTAIRHYHSANLKYSRKYSRKVAMVWLSGNNL